MYYSNYPINKCEIVHVTGEQGAKAFQMMPNSNILLLDDTAPIIWLKVTDGAGYPSLTGYKIEPLVTADHKDDFDKLEERIRKIEEKINESNANTIKG